MASGTKDLGYFGAILDVTSIALDVVGLIPGLEVPDELLAVFGGSNNDPSLDLLNQIDSKLDIIAEQGRQVLDAIASVKGDIHQGVILDITTDSETARTQLGLYRDNGGANYRDDAETYSTRALTRAVLYAENSGSEIRVVVPALLTALMTRINVIRDAGDGATSGEYGTELRRAINALDSRISNYRTESNTLVRTYANVSVRNNSDVYLQVRYNNNLGTDPIFGNNDITSQYQMYVGQNGSPEVSRMLGALYGNMTLHGNVYIENIDILDMVTIRDLYLHGENTFMNKEQTLKSPLGEFDRRTNYIFDAWINERTGVADMEAAVDALRGVVSGQRVIDVDGTNNGTIRVPDVGGAATAPHTLEGRGGNDTIIGNGGNDTLRGGGGDPARYEGNTDGNDSLYGNGGDDIMLGGTGNDWLDGGAGDDRMDGGTGSDTASYASATSGVYVSLDLTGWQETQSGKDRLLSIENLTGSNFDDTLKGDSKNNTISGLAGNDYLKGGLGADRMIGGVGDDLYSVDNVRDTVVEVAGEGHDSVNTSISYTLTANVEDLYLIGSSTNEVVRVTGNAGANYIQGNDSANILDGKAGADRMYGAGGNDTYYVDNRGDAVEEIESWTERDHVFASISYSLGAWVEDLTLTGTDDLKGTGNEFGNVLTGNSGNNVLNGGAGTDTLRGGAGNDTYVVDNLGDKVVEANGGGTDTVRSSVGFSLAGQYIENLTLTGTGAVNGTGNSLANRLVGNAAANILDGGTGADILIGGGGSDSFAFRAALGSGVDRITDFSPAAAGNDDTILLSGSVFGLSQGVLKSMAFKDLGVQGARLDASDRIVYDRRTGALAYDADGSGAKAAVQFATVDTKAALTCADFRIV